MKDEKRRARLVELLSRLESGVDVATRDMKSVLTEVEFIRYQDLWDAEKSNRKIDKPPAIKKYEAMVKQAYAAEARLRRYMNRGASQIAAVQKRMIHEPDNLSESAYLYFIEIINSGYRSYFDYRTIPDDGSSPSSPCELPLVIGSKSGSHGDQRQEVVTKRQCKLISLQEALDVMDRVLDELSDEQAIKEFKEQLDKGKNKNKRKLDGFKV